MKLFLFPFVHALSVLSVILLITCSNHTTDQNGNKADNVFAKLTVLNDIQSLYQGDSVKIRMIVRYPEYVKKIGIFFDSTMQDTVIDSSLSTDTYDTLFFTKVFTIAGKKTVEAELTLSDTTFRIFNLSFTVNKKSSFFAFQSKPADHGIVAGKPDTIKFSVISDSAVLFTSSVNPPLDTGFYKTIVNGSNLTVIITAPNENAYTLHVNAQSGNQKDSAIVKLVSYAKTHMQELSNVTVMSLQSANTLKFTAAANESDTVKALQILNKSAFKNGEILTLSTGIDTCGFIFTPQENKVYVFVFEATVNSRKDTLSYCISVVRNTSYLLKQDTVTVNAIEGSMMSFNLGSCLADTTITDTQISAGKGTVTGRVLEYRIPFGSVSRDSIIVTVKGSGNESSTIKIYLNVSASDTLKPQILREFPSDSVFTTSEPTIICKFRITDSGAGTGNVRFSRGNTVLSDTVHEDSIYQCTITNLLQGQTTAIKVKATDKSMNRNSDSLTVYLLYDSTLVDKTGPVITLVNPQEDAARVGSSSMNVTVSCSDPNDVENVTCKLGETAMTVVKGTDNTFVASVNGLQPGENKLLFSAIDGSSNANNSSKTFTVIYDPTMNDDVPPVITLMRPVVNGGKVTRDSVTVIISCRDDNDIASVTCLRSGSSLNVVKNNDSIYSVLVTGLHANSADTVIFYVADKSLAANVNKYPVILKYTVYTVTYNGNGSTSGTTPSNGLKYEDSSTVIVAGNSGNLKRDGYNFGGWNTSADGFGTAYVEGNALRIASSNVVLYAQWKKLYSVTYYGNGNSSGSVPVDGASYETGTNVSVLANSGNLRKTGHQFSGWNTIAEGTGSTFIVPGSFEMGSSNVNLYALWTPDPNRYSITYNGNGNTGGTVPLDQTEYACFEQTIVKTNSGNLERKGYTFRGWNTIDNGSGNDFQEGSSILIENSNITLYAKWDIVNYSIKYELDSGVNAPENPDKYTVESDDIILKNPSRDDYLFKGWHQNADFSDESVLSIPKGSSGNITLYAKWEIDNPEITTQPADVNANAGDTVTFSVSVKENLKTTFHYSWLKNDIPITGADGSTLTIPDVNRSDSGAKISCIISTAARSLTTSNSAVLSVLSVKMVACGQYFTMILKTDGSLWATGNNQYGQFGNGSTDSYTTAKKIMDNVASVSAGKGHALILRNDGVLLGAGLNSRGQLGVGTTTDALTPVEIKSDVAAVSAGEEYSMILSTDGKLYATGANSSGQLCDGTKDDQLSPVKVLDDVAAVSAGYSHTMIILKNGHLLACGANSYGQLGDSLYENRSTPKEIMSDVVMVAAGGNHTLILKNDGTVLSTGSNANGQLGTGLEEPIRRSIPEVVMSNISAVCAGGMHSIALTTDNKILACGKNNSGQLGDGLNNNYNYKPKEMQISDAAGICGGYLHSIIIKTDGSVWATGNNSSGQLGDSTTDNRSIPVKIRFR